MTEDADSGVLNGDDIESESMILAEDDTLTGGEVLPGFSVVVKEILPPAGQPDRA